MHLKEALLRKQAASVSSWRRWNRLFGQVKDTTGDLANRLTRTATKYELPEDMSKMPRLLDELYPGNLNAGYARSLTASQLLDNLDNALKYKALNKYNRSFIEALDPAADQVAVQAGRKRTVENMRRLRNNRYRLRRWLDQSYGGYDVNQLPSGQQSALLTLQDMAKNKGRMGEEIGQLDKIYKNFIQQGKSVPMTITGAQWFDEDSLAGLLKLKLRGLKTGAKEMATEAGRDYKHMLNNLMRMQGQAPGKFWPKYTKFTENIRELLQAIKNIKE